MTQSMVKKLKNTKLLKCINLLAICMFLAIMSLAYIPLRLSLVFQPNQSTNQLAYIPLKGVSQFKIKYTHSIHLSDVVESYNITAEQKIEQFELMYEDFSIGMPANADKGETFEHANGQYFIKNMKRIFPFFHLRIGQVRANHRVIFQNKEYPLSRTLKPGTSVKVEIRRISLFQQWKGVNILESL